MKEVRHATSESGLAAKPLSHTDVPPSPDSSAAPGGISRRGLPTYALSAPVMTMAAGLGMPRDALAALPLTPPGITDFYDLGDAITQSSLATMPVMRLSVGTNGRVAFELPRAESGQGISTALAMMIAEEMDVPVSMVDVTLSAARPELMFNQLNGGSTAIRSFAGVLPLMAAQALARLLLVAAQQWGVSSSSLSTANGQVLAQDGRRATYATLTLGASLIPPPLNVLPKTVSQYHMVGKARRRIDEMDIVTGKKQFTSTCPSRQTPGHAGRSCSQGVPVFFIICVSSFSLTWHRFHFLRHPTCRMTRLVNGRSLNLKRSFKFFVNTPMRQ